MLTKSPPILSGSPLVTFSSVFTGERLGSLSILFFGAVAFGAVFFVGAFLGALCVGFDADF